MMHTACGDGMEDKAAEYAAEATSLAKTVETAVENNQIFTYDVVRMVYLEVEVLKLHDHAETVDAVRRAYNIVRESKTRMFAALARRISIYTECAALSLELMKNYLRVDSVVNVGSIQTANKNVRQQCDAAMLMTSWLDKYAEVVEPEVLARIHADVGRVADILARAKKYSLWVARADANNFDVARFKRRVRRMDKSVRARRRPSP